MYLFKQNPIMKREHTKSYICTLCKHSLIFSGKYKNLALFEKVLHTLQDKTQI